jgi:DNA polymerase-1
MKLPVAVDFETHPIVGNPVMFPPKPVGVAIWEGDKEPTYTDNYSYLAEIWHSGAPMVFHNAPFDVRVAEEHLGLPFPEWDRIHDTTYLVFLKNPHALSLGLKSSAETYLDLPPEEQDDLKEWILKNVPGATQKNFGAYIYKAPFELVARYAKGDVLRTRLLFEKLWPAVPVAPYDRERRLMPILVAATRKGVRVNRAALNAAYDRSKQAQQRCEQLIRANLRAPTLNPHSGPELAAALDKAGKMDKWFLTPTGRKSTARENLIAGVNDPELLKLLVYTGAMQTAVGTFVEPWLEKSAADGRLHPNWNQVRQPGERGGGLKGTRTGRLSSDDPNLQNVPNPFGFELPEGLVQVPEMRTFLLPEEGHVWLKRDFSGQEMRILAHYEEGSLYEAYRANPNLDPHEMVRQLIHTKIGKEFLRRFIKETGFGMIYGMGALGLAKKIGIPVGEGRELQDAYKLALPGVGQMQAATRQRGRNGQPITTWGGREYYVEEPKIIAGNYRSFEYKLLNYLIQGSAADQTKQCIIHWDARRGSSAVFLATVHDEISISAEIGGEWEAMECLRECMDQDLFDVPMRSDSFKGPNWGQLEEYLHEH